jgi:hypothetical protein
MEWEEIGTVNNDGVIITVSFSKLPTPDGEKELFRATASVKSRYSVYEYLGFGTSYMSACVALLNGM